jgi:signal transduction histidine kinase
VLRIGSIVQNLADAANLEEALASDEMESMDLAVLLQSYIGNCRVTHPDHAFAYHGKTSKVFARVSDYRIEQLLDKLVDNAIDFTTGDDPIEIGLTAAGDWLTISVMNRGRPLAPEALEHIFESMVSIRDTSADARLHFGMGLYVVRVITEHHGGTVRASNLPGGAGVRIDVNLPRDRARSAENAQG